MNILFLCSSNVFRSQMAEAFFNNLSKSHTAKSAALIKPQDKMHKLVVKAMKEEGIDISRNKSKMVTKEMLKQADVIILISKNLEPALNNYKNILNDNVKIEAWDIPDVVAAETDGHLYPEFVNALGIIKQKIKTLINSLS